MQGLGGMTGFELDPAVPLWLLGAGLLCLILIFGWGMWRGMRGAWLRFFAGLALLFALAGPRITQELRDPLSDIAVLLVDESASQEIDGRAELTSATRTAIEQAVAGLSDETLELRVVPVSSSSEDAAQDPGTRLVTALETALADVGDDRVAGVIAVTDGRAHDAPDFSLLGEEEIAARFPGPVHMLSTGREGEFDRRLVLESAPSFGIVGEDVSIRLRVENLGPVPANAPPPELTLSIDGIPVRRDRLRVGEAVTLTTPLPKGGASVFQIDVAGLDDELTLRNNRALFTVQGARDRLRVLLVSGQPHAGERSWRNLLKADPSVDLVHFTILRPPSKLSGTPINELSLIPFPTRELFMEKVDDFDLVIFDKYVRRGVLAPAYLANVADYVRRGGAVMIAAGPDFGGPASLYRSPLGTIMPAAPTGGTIEEVFRPLLSEQGLKHPVTSDLPGGSVDDPDWGPWVRLIEIDPREGDVLMRGPQEEPVLILNRVEEGRVAMLASDTAWLWERGYQGGGPLAEMLRRVAHWLMKEPQLEEDALTASVSGARVEIVRRSLGDAAEQAQIIAPSGARLTLDFEQAGEGRFIARFEAEEQGLYSITAGTLETSAAVGPAAPKEFENPLAGFELLGPLTEATGGARVILREEGAPRIRRVAGRQRAYGPGWIGLKERGAYVVRDQRAVPLATGWLMLILSALLLLAAWRQEGR